MVKETARGNIIFATIRKSLTVIIWKEKPISHFIDHL